MGDGYWQLFWETGAPEFYLGTRSALENASGAGAAAQPQEDG